MRDLLAREYRRAYRRWVAIAAACLVLSAVFIAAGRGTALVTTILIAVNLLCIISLILGRFRGAVGPDLDDSYSSEIVNHHSMATVVDLQGNILDANANFCRVLKFSSDEVIGANMLERCYFSSDQETYNSIRLIVASGETWSGDVRLRAKDGAEVWTHTTIMPTRSMLGKVTGAVIIRNDVTDVKKARDIVDFMNTFDNLIDPVAIFSNETARIEYLNKSGLELFKMAPDDLGQKTLTDLEMNYDYEMVRARTAKLIRERLDFVDFTLSLNENTFDVRVQCVTNPFGQRQLIAYFRDRTERDRLEREKSQFVSTVSHELRTPLTSIKGALGLALSTGLQGVPGRVEDLLNMAHRNADRLILIVNDILDLEKMDAGQMPFDLTETSLDRVVIDAIQANQPYFDELGVSVDLQHPNHEVLADIDRDRVTQVLTNLLSNAAKFSKRGAEVTVSIWQESETVGFSVTDRGVGIPESEIETIFERFRQAKNSKRASKGGTGLGLAIVQTIMHRHAGDVTLESDEGVGTTVHCEFPRLNVVATETSTSAIA